MRYRQGDFLYMGSSDDEESYLLVRSVNVFLVAHSRVDLAKFASALTNDALRRQAQHDEVAAKYQGELLPLTFDLP